jgi:all-trans-retinol 13,14-reductase
VTTAEKPQPRSVRVGRPLPDEGLRGSYDTVVIGSGVGGLAAAVCHAKRGRTVAVFEQHYTAGGYTHAYQRRGWEWDVGIHYIGQLSGREPVRVLSDYLTDDGLEWASLGDPFDVYRLNGEVYTGRVGYAAYRAGLIERFPAEQGAIEEFFRRVRRCVPVLPLMTLRRMSGPVAARTARLIRKLAPDYALRPAREVVSELTTDERLRLALLSSTALLVVENTADLPFMMLAFVYEHFRTGACYPVGGSAQIARSMLGPIRRAGGEVFVRARVREILVENGVAAGVILADGRTVRAATVISNAGARNTFGKLLPADVAAEHGYPDLLANVKDSYSMAVLFVGLVGTPAALGLPKHNVLVLEDDDPDRFYRQAPQSDHWMTSGLFISFSSAKDPTWTARHPERSTGEVIAFCRPEWFRDWSGTQWNERGSAYLEFKERIAKELLDTLYRHLPELEGKVVYHELATPLTAEHFAAWSGGCLYGTAMNSENLLNQGSWLRPRTRVPGLFLSGQDAMSGGYVGALTGGVLAAHESFTRSDRIRLWAGVLRHLIRGPRTEIRS